MVSGKGIRVLVQRGTFVQKLLCWEEGLRISKRKARQVFDQMALVNDTSVMRGLELPTMGNKYIVC